MPPQAPQDEQQARETTVGARTSDPVGADTGLSASSEALNMSFAARLKSPKSQIFDPVLVIAFCFFLSSLFSFFSFFL